MAQNTNVDDWKKLDQEGLLSPREKLHIIRRREK